MLEVRVVDDMRTALRTEEKNRLRLLYVVYWGAAEPLGQSLVLPAVLKLASQGAEVTLVTFEKPVDLADRARMATIRASLAGRGIRWVPLRYHRRPKVPATAFDMIHGCSRGLLARLRVRPDMIHARTFIGGLIGYALASLLRVPWIYHNEGFYPDEQVDGGVWEAGSRVHRLAMALERRMYERANGIIALSHRARSQVACMPEVRRRKTPTIVVPSCVNLADFPMRRPLLAAGGETLRLVYIGTIGRRYLFDGVVRFAAAAARELGQVHLRVLSRTEPSVVESVVRQTDLPTGSWTLDCVPHAAIPGELESRDAGLFFLTQGRSEHGCSPTKVGEYWASGLPVVTTPNVSDTDQIVQRERVGVIIRGHSDEEYRRGAHELRELLNDPGLPDRCRRAAEAHYSLAAACDRQMALYREILSW
jgi:glycosyltransferase involved in cell wall biosynthesis